MSTQRKENFVTDVKLIFWEDPFLFKSVRIKLFDVVFLAKKPMTSSWLATMVPPVDITVLTTQQEKSSILDSFGPQSTKMPMSGYKPTHANVLSKNFTTGWKCTKFIQVCEFFDAKALPTNDARVVVRFLKALFARFGTPRAIISDRGTHFCNDQFAKDCPDCEDSRALSFVFHPQEFHILSFILGIQPFIKCANRDKTLVRLDLDTGFLKMKLKDVKLLWMKDKNESRESSQFRAIQDN
ncbi:reverse transcriptase domain-containing protein [Tanacetum coccineum]